MAILEPEREFQKAAIDACRSTIVQQEAELKRLGECLDIRNKKVMQLESQVGVAKSYLSSRDVNPAESSTSTNTDQITSLLTSVNLMLTKLAGIPDNLTQKTQSVNVYNNTCHHQTPALADKGCQTPPDLVGSPSSLQTDLNNATAIEDIQADTTRSIPDVGEPSKDSGDAPEDILICTVCNNKLESTDQLESHLESAHRQASIPAAGSNHG